MYKLKPYIIICLMLISFSMNAQVKSKVTTKKIDNVEITTTEAIFLGQSKSIRESTLKSTTSAEKKKNSKINKKVPDNFKGRKNRSSAVDFSKEHQGPDPVLQSENYRSLNNQIEVLVNRQGLGSGSPTDPTGDVSNTFYVQAVNATEVAVFDLEGNFEMSFSMNTLWTQFGVASEGDPIILYDEIEDKWVLTEFTDPANILVAVSVTSDPLGAYNVYNFSTPQFPDYPKYGITPEALVVTTNEEDGGTLHQYFINKDELMAGGANATIQRVAVAGTNGSEQSFYVSTPVDWNGSNMPYDNRPIVMRLNDSSWAGGPDQDGLELYSFEVDFDNPNNTQVIQTTIPTSPFDAFPCASTGNGFECIPQMGGSGIDGVPEIIMHVPHQRNFGTHESIVLSFITDVTDGNNLSGVRWVELRRTSTSDWSVYQEGTFAPDDNLHRFMPSIAIDDKGNICLGYNVSGENAFAGIRATARNAEDPLGEMTYQEVVLQEGQSTNPAFFGRFGDYAQMSASPRGAGVFWLTAEYAGPSSVITNISALGLGRDSIDLSLRSFLSPSTTSSLTSQEEVTVEIVNAGINPVSNYTVELEFEGTVVSTSVVSDTLQVNEIITLTFDDNIDISEVREYNFRAFVSATQDPNPFNDTLALNINVLPGLEATLSGTTSSTQCDGTIQGTLVLENLGGDVITAATIAATVNSAAQPDITFSGSISNNQRAEIGFNFPSGGPGINELNFELLSLNGVNGDFDATNNILNLETETLDANSFVTVILNTDNFPEETTYSITSQTTGEVIFEFGDLSNMGDANSEIITSVCLDLDDCYSITINDSYGDGICCLYGIGNLTIRDNVGNMLAFSDGEFGNTTTIDFCATFEECTLAAEIEVTASEENDNTGIILINATGGTPPLQYSIDGGATFSSSNVFPDLAGGEYDIVVADSTNDCIYEETVEILVLTTTYQVEGATVTVDILPNPTDGVFKLNVLNLPTANNQLEVNIYDIQGKLIQQRKIGKFNNDFIGSFSLYGYPAGTYFVHIGTPELNILEKVVKQ